MYHPLVTSLNAVDLDLLSGLMLISIGWAIGSSLAALEGSHPTRLSKVLD